MESHPRQLVIWSGPGLARLFALMVFQEQQTEKLAEEFKNNQAVFLSSLTEKLIKVGKLKRSTTLIKTLIIANIVLTISCVILVLNG